MTEFYTLADDGRTPVRCPDVRAWSEWMTSHSNRLAFCQFGDCYISTVFLGLRMYGTADDPLLFETKMFGGSYDKIQVLSSTWEQALQCHAAAVGLTTKNQVTCRVKS